MGTVSYSPFLFEVPRSGCIDPPQSIDTAKDSQNRLKILRALVIDNFTDLPYRFLSRCLDKER